MMNIIFTTSTNHKEDINKLIHTRELLSLLFYSRISPVTFQNKQRPMLPLGKRQEEAKARAAP